MTVQDHMYLDFRPASESEGLTRFTDDPKLMRFGRCLRQLGLVCTPLGCAKTGGRSYCQSRIVVDPEAVSKLILQPGPGVYRHKTFAQLLAEL